MTEMKFCGPNVRQYMMTVAVPPCCSLQQCSPVLSCKSCLVTPVWSTKIQRFCDRYKKL